MPPGNTKWSRFTLHTRLRLLAQLLLPALAGGGPRGCVWFAAHRVWVGTSGPSEGIMHSSAP